MRNISWFICAGVCILTVHVWAASAPSDVRVSPLLSTTWGQTTVGGNACFNYYTPDSAGYPPTTAGAAGNYPSGCVATGMAQIMNYHQWANTMYPFGTRFTIYADGITYPNVTLMGGTLPSGNYDWTLMQSISSNVLARQEVGRLLHDLGAALSMQYWSWANWGSATDFDYIDNVFNGFSYSNAITIEGNYVTGGTLFPQSIPTILAEQAIVTNLDAGLPVLIGVNDNTLQNGHVLVLDGYGIDAAGATWYHWNFGLPVQGTGSASVTNLGWYTLPAGAGSSTATSAGYDVLDGVAFNIFPAPGPSIPTGEIISGRITDRFGNAINGARVDITGPIAPVTVYTNANGIYAAYGSIASNQVYTVTASATGYQMQSLPCFVGLSQKTWVSTGSSDGYYNNTVGNAHLDMALQYGTCDLVEFAGFAQHWNSYHTTTAGSANRYDYNGDWNVDMQDLQRIIQAWLTMPVQFRTQFDILFDPSMSSLPANYPWQYAGNGGAWTIVDNPIVAAESPTIGDSQSTSFKLPVKMFTGVPGSVDINFMLSCDTEMGNDVFEFLVDGVVQSDLSMQTAFSGPINDQPLSFHLTGVTFGEVKTLEWRYTKNAANSMGADKVWISQIMVMAQP